MVSTSRSAGVLRRFFIAFLLVTSFAASVQGDPFPPAWNGLSNCGTSGDACHFEPAPWPSEPADPADCGANCGDWQPYTRFQGSVNDPRVQDPSNGGTRPQNYVNIASSCSDTAKPSIYYSLQRGATPAEDVIMFRWRVEQIANTFATGPNPGSFSATDPWNSALWTVLFDVNGDGFRDLAAHLDGSSGGPSTPVDMIAGIWGDIPTQSISYPDDPSIHLIAHNPTGFVDLGTGRIVNFQNSLTPSTNWPNGTAETIWDHGTTRARLISTNSCNEYFIDYQIPVTMLDASSLGGPSIDRATPISMLFCTANSLNNPFQKDCAINKNWAASSTKEAPFGDYTSFDGGEFEQPIVDEIEAQGCGVFDLGAKVKDTIAIVNNEAARTVQAVDFYYYRDDNGNGLADDGNSWQLAVNGAPDPSPINAWSATWDATGLLNGQYLLGVQALDDPDQALYDDGITSDGIANRTFSYLTQGEVDALGPPPAGEAWFANPSATGVQSLAVAVNACGIPTPYMEKTVAQASGTTGGKASYTITVHNTLSSPLAVDSVTDHLPDGFSFVSTDGGSLSPNTSPANGATGDIQWTFSPAASIPANGSGTIELTVQLPGVTGTYQNTASAATDFSPSPLASDPVAIEVGAPQLSIAKNATPLSTVPDDLVNFTITYANDSPVGVTGATITDALPDGLEYVPGSASGGGVYDSGSNTITWNIGSLAAGSGSASVSFQANVANPYPATASVPLVNTATIDSDQTAPSNDSASIFVDVPRPRLILEKSSDTPIVDPGNNVVFTLRYANTGSGPAGGVVVTDTIPAGFTYVSGTPVPDSAPAVGGTGTVSWNIGTLADGGSGSVTLTLQADAIFTAANPAVNVATVDSTQTDPVNTNLDIGITQTGDVCETFYFRDESGNVGIDGTRQLATTSPVPQSSDIGGSTTVNLPTGSAYVPAVSFYQDPSAASEVTFSGTLTTTLFIDRSPGPAVTVRGTVYDYDSSTGTRTQLGQGIGSFGGSHTGSFSFGVALSGTLENGHRLLWEFEARSDQSNQTGTIQFQYDGTVPNQQSGSGSTFADSNAAFCVTAPANLLVQKTSSTASVTSGQSFSYTLEFANTGQTDATGSVITDTLPPEVTFDSATLNGSAVAPSVSGNEYSFNVSSTGSSGGTIVGGGTGTLIINVTANDPLDPTLREIINTASIASDQTQPVSDAVETPVEGVAAPGEPELVVEKAVGPGSLRPGDTASYTITVLNAGTAEATNVIVTDDVPDTAWYAYVPSSISGGDSSDDGTPGSLQWTINSLAPGASATLGFDMAVAGSGVPSGTTFLDNQAEASRDGLTGTVPSNTVPVAVTAAPSLTIQKDVDPVPPAGFWEPGDTFEYTLTVTNQGDADAQAVAVTDPIPTNTAFEAITQGSGSYDPGTNRVSFDLGTLTPGANATAAFSVRVTAPLPGNQALIDNTAVASADNAASAQDSAATDAQAVPVMELRKTGPEALPFPAASVAQAASGSAIITVDDTQLLSLGDTIRVAGQVARILNIGASTVTLDQAVTVSAGDAVDQAGTYAISWRNTGTGTATNVQVSDALPASFEFVNADPMPTSAPSGTGGTVTWDLGNVGPNASGTLELTVFPTTTGSFTNAATLSADNLASDVSDTADTDVGGLAIGKYTTTPVSSAGSTATWVLEVDNTLPTQVTGVRVTDVLPPGFTFNASTPVDFDGTGFSRTSTVDPADGAAFPEWGEFTIDGGGRLTITFEADIASSVGPATYQNDLLVEGNGAVALPFDPLSTTVEDVTVLAPDTGIVEGYVYRDVDTDGSFSSGDVPLAGVNVEITDSTSTLFIEATDSAGFFRRVVAAGSANVDVGGATDAGIPASLVLASGSADPESVSVPDGGTARKDTGYVPDSLVQDGTLTGHVFEDSNGNGLRDSGEPGLSGVDVTITTSQAGVLAVQTDGAGDLSVTVPEGDTDLVYTTPTGYTLTTANDTQTVNVPGGGSASAEDVGYQPPPLPTGEIAGHVFVDDNGNGVQDAGEPDLANVPIALDTSEGGTVNVTTDTGGDFQATVPEGATELAATGPTGYVLTTANDTQSLIVGASATTRADDIGYRPAGSTDTGTLSVLVFLDDNGNGTRESNEPRFSDIRVLVGLPDGIQLSLLTGPDGRIQATAPSGVAALEVLGPAGFELTTANDSQGVTVPDGGAVSGDDVGYEAALASNPGVLEGLVFQDVDGDGTRDGGEPGMADVTITVMTSGGDTLVAATDGTGRYQLTIPAGVTTATVADPSGFVLTTANRFQSLPVPASGSVSAGDVGYTDQAATRAIPAIGLPALLILILSLAAGGGLSLARTGRSARD